MKSKKGFVIFMVSMCFAPLLVTAADQTSHPDKINQILLDAKQGEAVGSNQSYAPSESADVNSVQYKIGFKDGYQKAVIDIKASMNTSGSSKGAIGATDATSSQNQALIVKSNELVSQSFNELVNKNDWDAAIEATSNAIDFYPKNSVAFINRSWAYAEKGQLDDAIQDATTAIELSPRNPMAYNNRGYAFELAGSRTRALQDYKISCELKFKPACKTIIKLEQIVASNKTKNEVNDLLDRSYEKFKQQDWVAVEDISTRTLKLDPSNEIAYVNRAGARAELGLYSPALADCYRAMELNPNQGLAHNNCAYAYERMGQADLAIHSYKEACDLGVKQSCQDYTRLSSIQH